MNRLGRHLLLSTIVALVSLPFLWMVLASLKEGAEIFREPERWLSTGWQLSNYQRAWRELPLARLYLNSLLVAAVVTLGQLATGALAGYAFARLSFPGRDKLFYLYLGSLALPHQVTLIPSFLILKWLGILDTYYALTVPFLAGPFAAFMMRQAFLEVPQALEDAARIDGCSRFQALFRVFLPLVRPSLVALGLLVFLWQWNSLLWPLVVTQSPGMRTLPVGLAALKSELGPDWPLLLAANTLAALPMLLLFLVAQKAFIQGLAHLEAD
ncbi:MAG: carbohydrate ABC transporter permease [Candidatus Acetothermia bacterium]|jgi:multiple sugar transport system permease protein|nr:carbohydrate ABC transporter permease [Candidatus Acetothermia bacterium]MDH7505702.1 carbohydrate ABC transporter permease [Candidatus Acetothermia bacterium]